MFENPFGVFRTGHYPPYYVRRKASALPMVPIIATLNSYVSKF